MTMLEEFDTDYALLVEAGFVAITQAQETMANELFQAAQVIRESETLPQIGLASVALHKLDTQTTNSILEEVLAKEPENCRAAVLLGISYILSKKDVNQGEELLKKAIECADDQPTRELATLWIEVIEKGIKKIDSPVQPQPPTSQD